MTESTPKSNTIAETENFIIWSAEEPDGEMTFHLELSNVTFHMLPEEWDEFLELVRGLK